MSVFPRAPRVLTYSHDGYGLGHLRRNLRLIAGLLAERPEATALAVTGCKFAHAFSPPARVDYLRLPAVTKVDRDSYAADGLAVSGRRMTSLRASVIAAAVEEFEPDLVLVDRHPLGLKGELSNALWRLRARGKPARVVLGLRDIIDAPETVRAEWRDKGHNQTIDQFYDLVLVYGSQAVYDPVAEYQLPTTVASKLQFTGYLADATSSAARPIVRDLDRRDGARLALCTLGGGKDAFHVASAFVAAISLLRDRGWNGLLVTGPFMSDEDHRRVLTAAESTAVAVRKFVPDLPDHLTSADAVLCMGGYNTLCEALSVGAAAVVVPRVRPRLEQWIRAEAFAARGLVRVIHPDALDALTVARELEVVVNGERERKLHAFAGLGTGGLRKAVELLTELLDDATQARLQMPQLAAER